MLLIGMACLPTYAAPARDIPDAVHKALSKEITFEFLDAPFQKAIEYFQRETKISFLFDPMTKKQLAGIAVTLKLDRIKALDALDLVCMEVDADWDVVNNIILVSTKEAIMARHVTTRVYDISSLLLVVQNFLGPDTDIDQALSNTGSGGSRGHLSGSGSGSSLFGDADVQRGDTETLATRKELLVSIIELIQDTTGQQEYWAVNGGDLFSLRELSGNLIIKATPAMHDEIHTLLASLQATARKMVSVQAQFFVVPRGVLRELLADRHGTLVLNSDEVGKFVERLVEAGSRNLGATRTTCFNTQRVFTYVGRDTTFLSDMEPVPDAGGVDVTLSTASGGVVMDVLPTISFNNQEIALIIRCDLVAGAHIRRIDVPVGAKRSVSIPIRSAGSVTGSVVPTDPSTTEKPQEIRGQASTTGYLRFAGEPSASGAVKLELPQQERIRVAAAMRVPDGGAVILTGVSDMLESVDAQRFEIVLVVQARIVD